MGWEGMEEGAGQERERTRRKGEKSKKVRGEKG